MRSSRTGLTAISLATVVFIGTALAQGTPATPPKPASIPAVTATPSKPTPPKAAIPTVSATVTPKAPKAPKAPASGPRTMVGEVVDPACWIINGVSGKGHAECAAACAKAGQTLAILEKGTNKLYLLAGEKPGEDPNKGVVEYVGQPVLVKGRVFARNGALGIQVSSIEPYNTKLSAAGTP